MLQRCWMEFSATSLRPSVPTCMPCHFPRSTSNESTFYDLFCSRVPNRHSLVEIGVIGQMTADRRIVAKDFVLDNRVSTAPCFEKIGLVIGNRVVTRRCSERLDFFIHAEIERYGRRIFFAPFIQVLLPQFSRPTVDRVALRFRECVLRLKRQSRILDSHGSFGAVKSQKPSGVIIQVAAKDDAEAGVVVKGFDEVRKVPAILPAEKAAGGLGALRDRVRAGNEMNPGNQVNKEVAGQAFAVVREATPAEKSDWVKRPLWRSVQKGVPVDRLFVCVRRNGVDPGAAGAVAV